MGGAFMSIKSYSPLRYPGGKNKISSYVINLINKNNLVGCTYIEPFAGGAAVALKLLLDGHVNNIIINDYDRSIYAFWYSVINHTEYLCNLIEQTEITIDEWKIQKEVQVNKSTEDLLRLGFSTLFLNRTNRSGIIKAGVMGGKNQDGQYKLDCRFKKKDIIEKIRVIGGKRDNIRLFNLDTSILIEEVIQNLNERSFIFFDPPYYKKGATLYVNYFNHEDHLSLSDKIRNIDNANWIVTYDYVNEIQDMYRDFRNDVYGLTYTVEKKYQGKEIIFYDNNLVIPEEHINIVKCNVGK